jgi:hypothetical protein
MAAHSTPPKQYAEIECAVPYDLAGKALLFVEDKEAKCDEQEIEKIIEYSHEYEVLPNIRFRDIL